MWCYFSDAGTLSSRRDSFISLLACWEDKVVPCRDNAFHQLAALAGPHDDELVPLVKAPSPWLNGPAINPCQYAMETIVADARREMRGDLRRSGPARASARASTSVGAPTLRTLLAHSTHSHPGTQQPHEHCHAQAWTALASDKSNTNRATMDPRGPVKFHNVHVCSMWKQICRLTISRDPSLMPKRMSCCIGSGTARGCHFVLTLWPSSPSLRLHLKWSPASLYIDQCMPIMHNAWPVTRSVMTGVSSCAQVLVQPVEYIPDQRDQQETVGSFVCFFFATVCLQLDVS
ncbi:hypothetical protein L1887_55563 [Cichorium endivia]|nr:hypothetical protein L1887_55563 [Cichorium endivia]